MTGTSTPWPVPPPASAPLIPPPVGRKHDVSTVVFWLVVGVGLFLGTALLALLLFAFGRPDAVAVGVLLAFIPVLPLTGCLVWLDRYEPEPRRLLVLAFCWGAVVATAAALLLQGAEEVFNGASQVVEGVVVAPVTEEAAKGLFVVLLLWSRRQVIDGVLDGLVYAGLVGVGFAFTENILYFAGAYTGGPDLGEGGLASVTALFVVRGVLSPFAHPLFTAATGIGVGIAVSTNKPWLRVVAPLAGYLVAVCLHAAWNASVFLDSGALFLLTYLFAMVPGFLAVAGLAIWFRVREGDMLARSLTDLAGHGYLRADEVPWLVRLPARRAARRNAAQRGGRTAELVMKEYQSQAIELAALHNRVLRGTAPPGSRERGALMVQRLHVLRANLLLPSHALVQVPRHARGWS